jgi:hypothetical protein
LSNKTVLEAPGLARELLETALKSLEKVYIIIDSLDKCDHDERRGLFCDPD